MKTTQSTRIFMRKYRRPARYTHAVYWKGEKIASIIRAYADMYSIAWHVDFFNFPRYGAICRSILEAAKHVESHKNVLIYEEDYSKPCNYETDYVK